MLVVEEDGLPMTTAAVEDDVSSSSPPVVGTGAAEATDPPSSLSSSLSSSSSSDGEGIGDVDVDVDADDNGMMEGKKICLVQVSAALSMPMDGISNKNSFLISAGLCISDCVSMYIRKEFIHRVEMRWT